jgi:protein SCO1/2
MRGVLLTALVLAVVASPAGSHEPAGGGRRPPGSPLSANPSLGVIRTAPDFTLLDVEGRAVRLTELRGRVVLLAFIYTSCPSACPLLTQRMAVLQQRLRAERLLPARVALVSITVDPQRDTAAALGRYARAFGAHRDAWPFLRESPERLAPVLAAYDEWTTRTSSGELDHPARLHLIDAQGRVREIYNLARFDERQAFLDIVSLLRGAP